MEGGAAGPVGGTEESGSIDQEQRDAAMQILTTEHFTLQSARGVAASESSSRSALFLTVLSAALVAVAPPRAATIWIGVGAAIVITATMFVHGRRRMRSANRMAPGRFARS